ncbi:MAG: L-threonylcarbamoyladenylate synthase [Terriglobia bacterium]
MSPILTVNPLHPQTELISRAARILQAGGLVAFPTETVYGLGANALDAAAVSKIFTVKERPATNPLIVHVHDAEAAQALVRVWPETARKLGQKLWPGPLTLVLPKQKEIPDKVTAGLDSVALRVPSHPVAQALLKISGLPVAAPSANRSSQLSPTTAQHVEKALGNQVELILDGGATNVGIESTVVDLTRERPLLLRPGVISLSELQAILGDIEIPEKPVHDREPRPSPGMMERHYAPRASLILFQAQDFEEIQEMVKRENLKGGKVGALLLTSLELPLQHPMVMPLEAASYARLLYAALHSLDDLGCTLILVERVPEEPRWAAIQDRLKRAAHPG